eukprot:GHVT01035004.1.p1 GENE.GHVT01035004.1~~GHVT01035004.1.p1  ORF type:complete len:263 (+),score=46.19 GHVT01035004.1:1635-2423(+)
MNSLASISSSSSSFPSVSTGQVYGSTSFNPKLILTQMIILQCCFFQIATVGIFVLFLLLRLPPRECRPVLAFFDASAYDLSTWRGAAVGIAVILAGVPMSFILRLIVERSRKCLDFVATYHILYLLACSICSNFPTTWSFWTTAGASVISTTLLAEYLCMQSELKEIIFDKQRDVEDVEASGCGRLVDAAVIGNVTGANAGTGNFGVKRTAWTQPEATELLPVVASSPTPAPSPAAPGRTGLGGGGGGGGGGRASEILQSLQ